MKQTYFFCLLFISFFSNAQIISIPNSNFKNKLLAANTSNGIAKNSLDVSIKIDTNSNGEIEVSEVNQVYGLYVSISSITSLVGIENFTNLRKLSCSYNNIASMNLSALTNLKELECQYQYVAMPSLNLQGLSSLEYVDCSANNIVNLNLTGLSNLTNLNCSSNDIVNINLADLTNLSIFNCGSNLITNLNFNNNINLTEISCSSNSLTSLNVSNLINLDYLSFSTNSITSSNLVLFNTNANTLTELYCTNNLLQSLNLSNLIHLDKLVCSNNQITSLDLSNNLALSSLICSNTQITDLDLSHNTDLTELNCFSNPNLNFINVKNNSIEYYFPSSTVFKFSNNLNLKYICCDSFQVDAINSQIVTYGYTNCHVNTYCSFVPGGTYYIIEGKQKFDDENNGCDVTDNLIPNLKFNITSGTTTGQLISNNSGNYSIPVQSGTHTITPILENPSYFTVSPTNVVVNFPSQSSPFTQDFCISANGTKHDVEVSIIPIEVARPGLDAFYKVIYKNKGNQTENGTINLQFDDAVLDVVSTNPAFTIQTTNNLSFNYSNLNPFETREINVVLNVNSPIETPVVNSGDILNFTATNTITNTDEMPSDNTFVLNQTVVNSYDPNDKTCLQGNYVTPDKIGDFVHYVIRFENTGTFPAQNIVVKDMIDTTKFDVASLVPLNASHNYVTKIAGNKVEFIFENINLPYDDANNDGYIAFKIKTLPTLVVGNTFSNSANIYFDYNFPIVTNTATTTIAALNNPSFEFANYFSLYPNPTTNELNINLKSAIEINSIQIYNTIGQLVTVQTGNALKVDVSNFKTGNYFIKINTNKGFSTSQFIKE